MRLTFYNAGHILGSSLVHLNIGNGMHNFMYTGDFNYEQSNLLSPAHTRFPRLETLMMESTYGGKEDNPPSRQECEDEVIRVIQETVQRGGKILFPSLGVGRSQEIVLILEKMIREGSIPAIPIYMQGLVWDITAIHTAYPEFLTPHIRKLIFHKDTNPFLDANIKHVGSRKEMQQIAEQEGPCLIVATSGMLTGGASLEYFKLLCDDARHSIILTSYQGPGTIGRKLQEGQKEFMLEGDTGKIEHFIVRASISIERGFSGHSSRNQLMNFIRHLQPRPKKAIIIHGENSKCLDLASSIHKLARIETVAPKNLESVRIR